MEYINTIFLTLESNYWLSFFLIIIVGFLFGSFHNVLTSRMLIMEKIHSINMLKSVSNNKLEFEIEDFYTKYKKYDLCSPESSCPHCGYKIKWYQNVPVLSYLFLRGKCSGCSNKISLEYPLVELFVAGLFAACFYFYGLTFEFLVFTSLFYLLSVSFITDIKENLVFDSISLFIFCLGLFYAFNIETISAYNQFLLSFSVYIGIYMFVFLYEKLRGFEGHMFGRGDIKILGALAAWLSIQGILYLIWVSAFICFLYYIFLFLMGTKNIREKETPFVPFIIISFVFVYYLI